MPFTRCWFYSDTGEPLRGGCSRLGAGCHFVHPGEPNWANARPSSRAKDRSDAGGFIPRGERDTRSTATSSARGSDATVTASGWDTSGGWYTGDGWGTSGRWDTGGSTSTRDQALEPTQSKSVFSTTKLWDTTQPRNIRNRADSVPTASGSGNTTSGGDGRGASADKTSGWGSTWDNGCGASSLGADNTAVKAAWRSTGNEWGVSWGDEKDAGLNTGSASESERNYEGEGGGGDHNTNSTASWGLTDPMTVDNKVGKGMGRNKGKGKAVLPPPRICIPEERKAKITETNNELLGVNQWGESRRSNIASTPTSVAPSTLTDSTRAKRKRDGVFDNEVEIFKEYVRTWERAVRAQFLAAEAEANRKRWFRTQTSACYTRIGEAGQKRLDNKGTEYDEEFRSQSFKLSTAITSLTGFHDKLSSNLDLGQRYRIGEETEMFVSESKAFVDEIRTLLVACVPENKDDVQSGGIQKPLSGTDLVLIGTLGSQARDLEERIEQAQTELTLRRQHDIRSEIDQISAAKIQALRVARQQEIDRITSQPQRETVIPSIALNTLEGSAQQVKEMEIKVAHITQDIRQLLSRLGSTTQRVNKLELELTTNKEKYRQRVQDMTAERVKTEQKIDKQVRHIREQFEQLVARQPPSPAAQRTTSLTATGLQDKMMESLLPVFEAILDKFFDKEVRPTIESMQQVVIEASDRRQEETIKVLWGKIQPAMNMVAGVSQWLDSQELGLTAPVLGARA